MIECIKRIASDKTVIFSEVFLVKAKKNCDGAWTTGYLFFDKKDKNKAYVGNFFQETIVSEKERCVNNDLDIDEINPDTICRCSGKRDVNGTLIFENDKIKVKGFVGIVKFGEYNETRRELGWYIEWISENAKFIREDFLFWQEKEIEVLKNKKDKKEK